MKTVDSEEKSLSGEEEILRDTRLTYDFDSLHFVIALLNLVSTKDQRKQWGRKREATISKKISLSDHLLRADKLSDFDEEEKEILSYLAYNLYENGYLWGSLRELLASSEEIFQISQKLKKKNFKDFYFLDWITSFKECQF